MSVMYCRGINSDIVNGDLVVCYDNVTRERSILYFNINVVFMYQIVIDMGVIFLLVR